MLNYAFKNAAKKYKLHLQPAAIQSNPDHLQMWSSWCNHTLSLHPELLGFFFSDKKSKCRQHVNTRCEWGKREHQGTKGRYGGRETVWAQKTKERARATVSEGNIKEPRQLTRLGRKVPVRAQCPRQAPGACYSKRHTLHAAQLWDGFTIFLTGHDISLGLAAEEIVWQPPADTLLGEPLVQRRDSAFFHKNWEKFANIIWCKSAESSWR